MFHFTKLVLVSILIVVYGKPNEDKKDDILTTIDLVIKAKAALPVRFPMNDNWTEGSKLMDSVYEYLSSNFNPGEGLKWNVVVLPTNKINHVHGDFVRINRNGWSVFAQIGPLSRLAECNEKYPFQTKQVRCQMIGCHHFNYKPVEYELFSDTSNLNGYFEYDKSKRCDIYDRK